MDIEHALQMKADCIVADWNQFLREWDIQNIALELTKNIYDKYPNDAELVCLWV